MNDEMILARLGYPEPRSIRVSAPQGAFGDYTLGGACTWKGERCVVTYIGPAAETAAASSMPADPFLTDVGPGPDAPLPAPEPDLALDVVSGDGAWTARIDQSWARARHLLGAQECLAFTLTAALSNGRHEHYTLSREVPHEVTVGVLVHARVAAEDDLRSFHNRLGGEPGDQ